MEREHHRCKPCAFIDIRIKQKLCSPLFEILRFVRRGLDRIEQGLVAGEEHTVIGQDHPPAVKYQIAYRMRH